MPRAAASLRRAVARPLLFGGVATALALLLAATTTFRAFEERAQALLLRQRGPLPWSERVFVIDLDEETFAQLGRPVPRALTARLLRALTAAGVAAVGFDIVYDNDAPDGPAADAAFADALAASGKAVLATDCYLSPRMAPDAIALQTLPPGPTPARQCPGVSLPRPAYLAHADVAHFGTGVSASGLVRSVAGVVEAGGLRLPPLALLTWLRGRGLGPEAVVQLSDALVAGGVRLDVDGAGDIPVSWRGYPEAQVLSFAGLVSALAPGEDRFDAETAARLRGAWVLVGSSVDSMGDVGVVASGLRQPLVSVHAALLNDLVEARPTRELPLALTLLLGALAGALLSAAATWLAVWRGVLALAALSCASFAGALVALSSSWLLAPLTPVLVGTLAWSAATAGALVERERERRLLTDAFGAYVHPRVLERILDDPSRFLALSGARKNLTVLFTDVCGFTALSNRLDPQEIVSLLREYLAEMTRLITEADGRVDKIMGDGILAVFGDPIAHEDHAARALDVALAMRTVLANLSTRWLAEGRTPITIRLGITTGEVFVGNIGSRGTKLEYTVLGAPVNLASRLEGRAPPGGVLVSQSTYEACLGAFDFQPVGTLSLKGFAERQPAWLLLGRKLGEVPGRQQARLHTSTPVRLHHAGAAVDGVATNVSLGGVFVETALKAPRDAPVTLEVPGWLGPRLEARVKWVGAGPSGAPGLGLAVPRGAEESAEASHVLAVLKFGREKE